MTMHRHIQQQGDKLLIYPPYSPDFASCDLYLLPIPRNKKKSRGRSFLSDQEALQTYEVEIFNVPQEAWSEAFACGFRGIHKFIQFKGDYFGKVLT